jgi:hypothetical protein
MFDTILSHVAISLEDRTPIGMTVEVIDKPRILNVLVDYRQFTTEVGCL